MKRYILILALFIAGCGGSSTTSSNPVPQNTTTVTSFVSNEASMLNGITYKNGVYIAVGESGTILYSTDGEIWKETILDNGLALMSVAYDGTKFVAVGEAGVVLNSADGEVWKTLEQQGYDWLYSVAGNTNLVAVGI